jgi:UDP-N-acetylglucosamine 2-epimerase (non-hydrolysing)
VKVLVVIGTRPEIIKMSPVIRELEARQVEYFILHTGQHYSYNLDKSLFEQLKLPMALYNLEVGSNSHAKQTAKILVGIERVLQKERPDLLLVEGDTNSVLASSLAAAKLDVRVGHIEAGLRSYSMQMPEEINRVLVDHCSDYLFAPTEKARDVLLYEGIPDHKIFLTGNTIVDAIYQNLEAMKGSRNVLDTLHLDQKEYLLATVHRQENVDDRKRFASIVAGLNMVSAEFRLPVVYPMHPHSQKRVSQFNLNLGDIRTIEPLDYIGFLELENYARLILTDSGGVQEEACILGIPCVTLRDNTERPETIDNGSNILSGTSASKILKCSAIMMTKEYSWANPFGDGRAGERITNIILEAEHG